MPKDRMTKRETLIFLKKSLGHFRRELTGDEYIEMRVILKLLIPFETGNSLHCFDEKYHYNGKIYQITYEINYLDSQPIIEELIEIGIPDK